MTKLNRGRFSLFASGWCFLSAVDCLFSGFYTGMIINLSLSFWTLYMGINDTDLDKN